jgi:WD40 repeat protein
MTKPAHEVRSALRRSDVRSDHSYVVTDGDDGEMRLRDAVAGNLIRSTDAGHEPIRDFAFSPDSKLLVRRYQGGFRYSAFPRPLSPLLCPHFFI